MFRCSFPPLKAPDVGRNSAPHSSRQAQLSAPWPCQNRPRAKGKDQTVCNSLPPNSTGTMLDSANCCNFESLRPPETHSGEVFANHPLTTVTSCLFRWGLLQPDAESVNSQGSAGPPPPASFEGADFNPQGCLGSPPQVKSRDVSTPSEVLDSTSRACSSQSRCWSWKPI